MLINAWSRAGDWDAIVTAATPEFRAELPDVEHESFDTMLARAECALSDTQDAISKAEALVETWPESLGAHVIATDIRRRHDAGRAEDMATRARTLLGPQSRYSERIMFAQLASFRDAFDDVIAALDGHVSTAQPSEPLSWLAWAFANSPPRPRTHLFFSSLPNDILALGNFARLAGVAESIRGDLRSAERHFRRALGASPDDLRAHLHLHSVLERDGRRSEAAKHILAIDENVIHGSADDKMRLACGFRGHRAHHCGLMARRIPSRSRAAFRELSAQHSEMIARNFG